MGLQADLFACIAKIRLGALIFRSVGRSVGPPKIIKNITKLYKTLQNMLQNITKQTVKEASAVCGSFLDGVVIFFKEIYHHFIAAFYFDSSHSYGLDISFP